MGLTFLSLVLCFRLTMMRFRESVAITLRILTLGGCCLGILHSLTLARADYLFKHDSEESIRSAIRLAPDDWAYYMRLAQFDREHGPELLTTSLRLNRYNAQAAIELGLQYEAAGDYKRAEELLRDAFDVDHTYLPRWSLANYYFRRGDMQAFWARARSAAEMPSEEIAPLFELCWRVSPDPERITENILNNKPEFLNQYLGFLLAKNQLSSASNVASRLILHGRVARDGPLLFSVVNRLVAANDAVAASALWHSMIDGRWVVADSTAPNNAGFAREPLPVSFDWVLPENPGLHSWPGPSGLESEFTGGQP